MWSGMVEIDPKMRFLGLEILVRRIARSGMAELRSKSAHEHRSCGVFKILGRRRPTRRASRKSTRTGGVRGSIFSLENYSPQIEAFSKFWVLTRIVGRPTSCGVFEILGFEPAHVGAQLRNGSIYSIIIIVTISCGKPSRNLLYNGEMCVVFKILGFEAHLVANLDISGVCGPILTGVSPLETGLDSPQVGPVDPRVSVFAGRFRPFFENPPTSHSHFQLARIVTNGFVHAETPIAPFNQSADLPFLPRMRPPPQPVPAASLINFAGKMPAIIYYRHCTVIPI